MAENKSSNPKPTRSVEAIRPPAAKPTLAVESTKQTTKSTGGAKQTNTLKIVLIVVGALVLMGIVGTILTGLLANRFVEGGLSALTGGKAKVDSKNGSVTITDDKKKSTLSTSQKLPDGFPSDVPVYQPSTIRFSASLAKNSYNVTLSTNDSPDAVKAYYTKQLKNEGWQEKANSSITFGAITTTTYTKESKEVTVVVTGNSDASRSTAVSLSVRTGQ